ncbi:MAG: hypothetical protein POH28_04815 [Acidocella sp.]|nr:hypothetical protein [Acidocella sp.]
MTRPLAVFMFILAPAFASAAPMVLPDQDVAVTYTMANPNTGPQTYNMSYFAAQELARVEAPAQGLYILANLPAGQAQIIVPALHAIVEAPDFSAYTQMLMHADSSSFHAIGPGHYAGLACETYLITEPQGTATACITATGVILHFKGTDTRGTADITATSVVFAPQSVANFQAPAGFSPINLPPGTLAALLQGQ